ncbi:MAG: hypothetical protein ACYDC6_15605, partial [Acidobacteriaceae bacterium]
SKSHVMRAAQSMPSKTEKGIVPEMSNCYCHPGKAGGSPFGNRGKQQNAGIKIAIIAVLVEVLDPPNRWRTRNTAKNSGKMRQENNR